MRTTDACKATAQWANATTDLFHLNIFFNKSIQALSTEARNSWVISSHFHFNQETLQNSIDSTLDDNAEQTCNCESNNECNSSQEYWAINFLIVSVKESGLCSNTIGKKTSQTSNGQSRKHQNS